MERLIIFYRSKPSGKPIHTRKHSPTLTITGIRLFTHSVTLGMFRAIIYPASPCELRWFKRG